MALMASACVLGVAVLFALFFWWKGRQVAEGEVFRASRWSSGNRLFPTQVSISPSGVLHYTPQWTGRLEHFIHMAHIASVQIDTNLLFSDLYIETTGGAKPVRCHGHRKVDAVRMKELIEQYQSEHYRAAVPAGSLDGQAVPSR